MTQNWVAEKNLEEEGEEVVKVDLKVDLKDQENN
jgi:hypothetical protein